jgi:hypothetical protein
VSGVGEQFSQVGQRFNLLGEGGEGVQPEKVEVFGPGGGVRVGDGAALVDLDAELP